MYGKSGNSEAYQRYMICKEFGWDFYTYESQPNSFIEEIMIIMNQVAQKAAKDAERSVRPRPAK